MAHRRSRHRSAESLAAIAIGVLGAACIVPMQYEPAAGETTTGGSPGLGEGAPAGTSDNDLDSAPPMSTTTGGGGSSGGDMEDPPAPPNGGDCCEPGDGGGCGDPAIRDCVCAVDMRCCTDAWDALCVDHIALLGCGACTVGPRGTDSIDCCSVHEQPSCADPFVADCVCASDPYCCDVAWDQVCVDAIGGYGCGACVGPLAPVDDCCTPSDMGGCPDPVVAECVCGYDPYCCDTAWDELCIDEAATYCGGCYGEGATTGEPVDPGDCCAVGAGPTCDDPAITMCVCAVDEYCCETLWDEVCVSEVEVLGCGVCDGNGTSGAGTNAGTSTDTGSSGSY